jgi:hypothetical protein
MSFSASGGWNEQVSEVTVQLVEDTCTAPAEAPKRYFDLSLAEQTTTAVDPGFFGLTTPIIGAPVYFRVGDFEFSGLVQSWEQQNSASGNPVFSVKIVDPRQILEGAQAIINEYAGGVGAIHNLINCFGYSESTGSGNCPEYYQSAPGVYTLGNGSVDGTIFGSPAGKFGGADVNKNGMQWNQILASTRILLSTYPATVNQWSPYGRLALKAPSSYPATGMGIMPADLGGLAYYYIDFEEVPIAPSYWRLNGTNVSLMDAVTQICQDSGHDYYVELIPVVDAILGPGIHKFIKVRTANRVAAPALNAIDTFIAVSGREVLNYNKGREFRNEVTNALVIGGPKQSFYQAEQSFDPEGDGQPVPPEADDMIIPYFGLDPDTGNVIIPTINADGWWEINAPSQDLAAQLANAKYGLAVSSTLKVDEAEMVAARAGMDTWMAWAGEQDTELWQALNLNMRGAWDVEHIIKLIKNITLTGGKMRPADMIALRKGVFQPHADNVDFEKIQIGFAWLEKFVKEYYGKKYQVRIPFTCGKVDSESGIVLTSEEPTDGGWTEVTPVLGLAHPSIFTDFFSLDDNRLGAFCRFDVASNLELSNSSVNDFVVTGGKAWIKVGVEPEFVYYDKNTLFSPRVIITLPQEMLSIEHEPDQNVQWRGIVDLLTKFKAAAARAGGAAAVNARLKDIQKRLGTMTMHLPTSQKAIVPDAVGVGIQSNVLKYGPWAPGTPGPAGSVAVQSDEGLVPWEYGGFTTLNLAGIATADAQVTGTQVTEEGSITVAGYPELPLGAELRAADTGGPFNGGGNNLVENRSAAVASGSAYYAPIYPWDGTFGPNVTGIQTSVSDSGLQTTYNLKIWTPKFGVFARGNAQRLKQVGQQRLKGQKQLRAWTLQRLKRRQIALLDKIAGDRPGVKMDAGAFGAARTPHEILAGEIIDWNTGAYKRPLVASESTIELPVEMADGYGEKAFMSLDGLLRPVSVNGSGGLPPYANFGTNCQVTSNRGAQPPIDKKGEAGNYAQYNIDHTQTYLDPFSNPSGNLVSDLSDTPGHGHDIEIIGRGTGIPASSMVMPVQGWTDSEDLSVSDHRDDYRMLALRGPLLLQSWGYDLDGWPIPNKVDTPSNARNGVFTDSNLNCKFMDNWLRQGDTWPVAPVDLRYDRQRGVWTIPQYRSIVAKLECCIPPKGTGLGTQISGPTLYDCDGAAISEPQMILKDEVGHPCLQSGDCVIAEYDPYECEYRIVEHKSTAEGDEVFKFRLLECVCIDFVHRQEQYAEAMRLKWNQTTKSWDDDCEVKLYPGCCNGQFGPAQSGLCGWATITPSKSTGSCNQQDCTNPCSPTGEDYCNFHSPTGSGGGQVIWMEHMAEWIDFTTTENVGCLDDNCFSAGVKSRGAEVTINSSWEGVQPNAQCTVVAYFGNNINLTCLRGYQDCDPQDTVFTYKGVGRIDREASSQAICGDTGNCYNPITCCKWVYRVTDLDNPMRAADQCCTGNFSTAMGGEEGMPFYEIVTRSGLRSSIDGCKLVLDNGHRIVDSNCCLTPQSGYPRNALGIPKSFDTLNLGAGLWVHHAEDSLEDCGLSPLDPECDNVKCLAHVMAGIRPLESNDCCTGTLTTDGSRFFNVMEFQGGLKACDGPNSCDILVRAGIDARERVGCINDIQGTPTQGDINHIIEFMNGICVKDDVQDDCKIQIGAGITPRNNNTCYCPYDPPSGSCISDLYFGRGIQGSNIQDDDCAVGINAGIDVYNSQGCVTGTPTQDCLKNRFNLLCGLKAQDNATDPCAIDIQGGTYYANSTGCVDGTLSANRLACTVNLKCGIKAQDTPGDDCGIDIMAGGHYTNSAGCVTGTVTSTLNKCNINLWDGLKAQNNADDECAVDIMAGHFVSNGAGCVTGTVGSTLKNRITLKDGLTAQNGADDCQVEIGAGVFYSAGAGCVAGSPTASKLKNKITLKDGLKGKDGTNDCDIELGAGIAFNGGGGCVSGSAGNSFTNKVTLGKGLFAQDDGNCTTSLGAGFSISGSTDNCVEQTDPMGPVTQLTAGKGIEIRKVADCEAEIGLYFDVCGTKVAQIDCGPCLKATPGDCSVALDLKEKYGDGTPTVSQTVITSFGVDCCPSGGIRNINYNTSSLNFNSCGQLISITAGSGGTLSCPCMSGTGLTYTTSPI